MPNHIPSVVGYAPAMLDINIESHASATGYLDVLSKFGVRPGDWTIIPTFEQLTAMISEMGAGELHGLLKARAHVELGSTIAGSFTAFNPKYHGELRLVLCVGVDEQGNVDLYSQIAMKRLADIGIKTVQASFLGTADLCVATYHKAIPDRTMLVYRGLLPPAARLDFASDHSALIFLSAFEVGRGFFEFDASLIRRNELLIAIGLGDRQILNAEVSFHIQELMRQGILAYLVGDLSEHLECFRGSEDKHQDIVTTTSSLSRIYPTTFLITAGATGMYGISQGQTHFIPANSVVGIVNTNGAGDAAAGAFISTHLATDDVDTALSYALDRAERVLRSGTGIIDSDADE